MGVASERGPARRGSGVRFRSCGWNRFGRPSESWDVGCLCRRDGAQEPAAEPAALRSADPDRARPHGGRGNADRLVCALRADGSTGVPALAELALLCETRSELERGQRRIRGPRASDGASGPHDSRRRSCSRGARARHRLDEVDASSAAARGAAAPRRPFDAPALVLPAARLERIGLGDGTPGAKRWLLVDLADRRLRRSCHGPWTASCARLGRGGRQRTLACALRFYARRFGDYPWSTYSLAVMKDFSGLNGTAYPTLSFLGDGSLVLVPHETAHQWFYSLVGNDQSRDPWLSEGLATWAQTGPENSLSQMLATPIPPAVHNRIGEPMSFWQSR